MNSYIKKQLITFLLTIIGSLGVIVAQSQGKPVADYNREKVFVHTDREFYLCGELIWFKIYCAEAQSGIPLNISKVAYVELLNRNSEPVLQAKVALGEEGGNGSLYLPLTLASDEYVLRAYTSWMKNADSSSFFEKRLSLVNTMRTARAAANATTTANDWEIAFFPEGGNMVAGVESKIGFKITDATGKGLDVKGTITDMEGNTVQSFASYKFGLGHFKLKPEAGKSYKAVIVDESGKTGTSALPQVQPAGYVLLASDNNDERVKVTVAAKMKEGYRQEEQVTLALHHAGQVKYTATQAISSGNDWIVYLNKSQLGNGVNFFTLFDRDGKPLSERLYFNRAGTPARLALTADKNSYGTQDMVNLAITPAGTATDTIMASLSVYKVESWQPLSPDNIVSYMSLTSALTGTIESPGYYFSNEQGVSEATDNLMLTHGWRRFAGKKDNVLAVHLPEYKGHFITGRVVNIKTGARVAGADCILSVPSAPYGFYLATSDSTGIIRFEVKDYYGPGEIFVQTTVEEAANYRVELLNPFSEEKYYTSLPEWTIDSTHAAALLEHSIAMQSSNIYTPDSIRKFELPPLIDTLPFFGTSEFDYELDDYKRFTTMEEVLREYVTPVNVTMRNSRLHMSMYNAITKEVYQNNFLVMLDGVPLPDPDKIFAYDPLKVKRLRIVSRPYIVGPRVFYGLASFETYKGRFDGFEIAPSLVAIDYEGLQMEREFYLPSRTTASAGVPDMRTTLLWKPDILIKGGAQQQINFPVSERKGNFIMILQGLSKNGQPVYSTGSFEVK